MKGISNDKSHVDNAHDGDEHSLNITIIGSNPLSSIPKGQGHDQELAGLTISESNSVHLGVLLSLALRLGDLA